jgi:2'-5' RNA ligase
MDDARGKETVQRVVREEDPTVGSFRVEEVRLKRSESTPDGPVYSTVESFAL